MSEPQMDLFAKRASQPAATDLHPLPAAPSPGSMSNSDIIDRLPRAGLKEAPGLAVEAGRRRLESAIPALEALCRRFSGFGKQRAVPEQEAAFHALGMIGGRDAKQAMTRLIVNCVVEGPSLLTAIKAASQAGARLPSNMVLTFLSHRDERIRTAACAFATSDFKIIQCLLECRHDENGDVRSAAMLALGRSGRDEARPWLMSQLRDRPTAEVIDAVASVADEDCIILLGRIARTKPDLCADALEALAINDHPTASMLLAQLQGPTRKTAARATSL